jgi:hypothetical protein
MTTTINARRIARYFVLPIMSAGIIGAGTLGMAGMANAATSTEPSGPGYSYAPVVKATQEPHPHLKRGVARVEAMIPSYHR